MQKNDILFQIGCRHSDCSNSNHELYEAKLYEHHIISYDNHMIFILTHWIEHSRSCQPLEAILEGSREEQGLPGEEGAGRGQEDLAEIVLHGALHEPDMGIEFQILFAAK